MTADELQELAGRLTLAEFVRLGELVLRDAYPEMEYGGFFGHMPEGTPDVTVVFTSPASSRPPTGSVSLPGGPI